MFNHESFIQQYIWNDKSENIMEISPSVTTTFHCLQCMSLVFVFKLQVNFFVGKPPPKKNFNTEKILKNHYLLFLIVVRVLECSPI